MAARARAALDGRPEVDVDDVKAMAAAVLRHRIVLNYNAESQGQTSQTVIHRLMEEIPTSNVDRATRSRVESVLK
jgi:MoxR-like ATPase